MYSFNLRTQPWIPVVDLKGDLLEVNLEEALLGAKRYKQIASDNPLEVAALHRFLLAVLHRALKGPSSAKDKARYLTQGFEGVEGYLQEFHHRFDLFDERWPFYQVPELPLEGNTQPHTRLSSRYGPNNTSALYNLKRPKAAALTSGISPAQAARSLLEHQTFCLGSLIQRFITSAPGAPAATSAHTLVLGDNLHQTLCLNLVHYPEHHSDQAVWEVAPPSIPYLQKDPQVVPKGLVHRYTWLARSIRLFPEVHDGQVVVRSLAYASGERPKDKIYQVPSGLEVATLVGHSESVATVVFSPSGQLLASGGLDNTIKLWDIPSKQAIATLKGHTNDVWALTFIYASLETRDFSQVGINP